jgi:hypothetical protein
MLHIYIDISSKIKFIVANDFFYLVTILATFFLLHIVTYTLMGFCSTSSQINKVEISEE